MWNYGHCTIPRHLRDVVITEYGIAAIRGREDREVIAALINIADSRFQEELLRQAQAAGKLSRDYRIPDLYRNNTPASLDRMLAAQRRAGLFLTTRSAPTSPARRSCSRKRSDVCASEPAP